MRSLLLNLSLLWVLLIPAFAQQPDSSQSQPTTEPQTKTNAPSKKAQSQPAKSPETPTATEEPKPEPSKESGDKAKDKEEHFDMTEVAPVVTHHQITVNGKLLHYTATEGAPPKLILLGWGFCPHITALPVEAVPTSARPALRHLQLLSSSAAAEQRTCQRVVGAGAGTSAAGLRILCHWLRNHAGTRASADQ